MPRASRMFLVKSLESFFLFWECYALERKQPLKKILNVFAENLLQNTHLNASTQFSVFVLSINVYQF